jgi:plastocyanin
MKTSVLRYQRALLLIPVIIFAGILYTGCSKSSNNGYGGGGGPGAGEVWMQNTKFNPATINIAVNGTVTWTNKDGFDHDVTADDSSFVSGNMVSGAKFAHKFTAAGTYHYRCVIHAGMTGTVIVE